MAGTNGKTEQAQAPVAPAFVGMKVENGYLTVVVPITSGVKSSTGKSNIFASTGGFQPVGDGYKLNLTLIKK